MLSARSLDRPPGLPGGCVGHRRRSGDLRAVFLLLGFIVVAGVGYVNLPDAEWAVGLYDDTDGDPTIKLTVSHPALRRVNCPGDTLPGWTIGYILSAIGLL